MLAGRDGLCVSTYIRRNDIDLRDTSGQGRVVLDPRRLVAALGWPDDPGCIDGKVTLEWLFTDECGRPFSLYDWKAESSPLLERKYEFAIGAREDADVESFVEYLSSLAGPEDRRES